LSDLKNLKNALNQAFIS